MPEVSVVIPVYNRERLIGRAIQSVLDQTFQDFELIVIDDHSSDNTLRTLENIRDRRIRVFSHKRNLGAQAARNTGIRNSKGRWISFLDSDDLYLVNSIAIRLDCARKENVKIVHSEGLVIDKGDSKPKWRRIPKMKGDIYRELLCRPGPAYQTLLVAHDALEAIGPLDETLPAYQEWETCLRLAKSFRFGFVEEPTYLYNRQEAISISKSANNSADGYIQILKRYESEIEDLCGKKALGSHYLRASYFLMRAGRKKEAMVWYRNAWKMNPFQARLWAYLPVIGIGGPLQKLVERMRFDH